jgi:glycerophosphoryl diester phosphodiesterase
MTPALPPAFTARPIAHRALHGPGRPENSRAAVAAAADAGYGIEIDLQMSADGVAMVFHDATLDRLTGATGPVRDRTAAELGRIGLGGASGADAAGIPRFAEILALVAGRVPLLVEIKDQSGRLGPTDGRLERAAAADLAGYAGDVAVMSFNPASVAAVAGAAPRVPRGLVTCAFRASSWPGVPAARRAALAAMDVAGAGFVSHCWRDLGMARLAEVKQAGLPVLCWTTRSPEQERQARAVADNVTFEGYLPA